jgi:hypothetical protein
MTAPDVCHVRKHVLKVQLEVSYKDMCLLISNNKTCCITIRCSRPAGSHAFRYPMADGGAKRHASWRKQLSYTVGPKKLRD